MALYQDKHELYKLYKEEYYNQADIKEIAAECEYFINSSHSKWKNVFIEDQLVGFFIVAKEPPDKTKECDREIIHAYIKKEYRTTPLLENTIKEYEENHDGSTIVSAKALTKS